MREIEGQRLLILIHKRLHVFMGNVGAIGTPKKAFGPTARSREFDLKLTHSSLAHPQKHSSPKTSTDAGIIMLIKPVPRNPAFPINDNPDLDTNATDKSDLFPEKQDP
jgi:hypothetical protein